MIKSMHNAYFALTQHLSVKNVLFRLFFDKRFKSNKENWNNYKIKKQDIKNSKLILDILL